MIVTFPGATPETRPDASTVATPVLLLDHAPPLLPLELKFILDPTHMDDGPLMAPAFRTGFTVTEADAVAVPQDVVMV